MDTLTIEPIITTAQADSTWHDWYLLITYGQDGINTDIALCHVTSISARIWYDLMKGKNVSIGSKSNFVLTSGDDTASIEIYSATSKLVTRCSFEKEVFCNKLVWALFKAQSMNCKMG